MSFSLFGFNPKYTLVFDISSATVSVAVLKHKHSKSSKPKILASRSVHIKFTKNDANSLASSLYTALEQSFEKIRRDLAVLKITSKELDAHTVLHAPWVESSTLTFSASFPKLQYFSFDFLFDFIKKEMGKQDESFISAYVTEILLNGYPVNNPSKTRISEIETSVFVTKAHPAIKKAINEFFKVVGVRKNYKSSFLHAVLVLAQNKVSEFTFVDVGGVYSQLAYIKGGKIITAVDIEFGVDDIYEEIAQKMKAPFDIAMSKLKMYQENSLIPTARRIVKTILNGAVADWVQAFGDACATASETFKLPENIFLFSDSSIYPFLREQIQRIDFAPFTVTARPFSVRPLVKKEYFADLFHPFVRSVDERALVSSLYVEKFTPKIEKYHVYFENN